MRKGKQFNSDSLLMQLLFICNLHSIFIGRDRSIKTNTLKTQSEGLTILSKISELGVDRHLFFVPPNLLVLSSIQFISCRQPTFQDTVLDTCCLNSKSPVAMDNQSNPNLQAWSKNDGGSQNPILSGNTPLMHEEETMSGHDGKVLITQSTLTALLAQNNALLSMQRDFKERLNAFENTVSGLKAENQLLKRDLGLLLECNDLCFIHFPRLPREIRLMIWDYAILEPHVHRFTLINGWQREFRGPMLATYHVNQESRQQTFKHSKSKSSHQDWYGNTMRLGLLKITDTFWRVDELDTHRPSEYHAWEYIWSLLEHARHPHVALDMNIWYEAADGHFVTNLLHGVFLNKVRVVTIVVGDDIPASTTHVVFKTPAKAPDRLLPKAEKFADLEFDGHLLKKHLVMKTWEEVEYDWNDQFKHTAAEYQKRRQAFLDGMSH